MSFFKRMLHRPFFIKIFHWEYWSFNAVYFPILIVYAWLSARARSFFFFSAANPSITNGGFLMESKKAIYDLMPQGSYPPTVYIKAGTPLENILQQIAQSNFSYPLICKPDVGGKGKGVKKIHSEEELTTYRDESLVDFLIQAYIPFEHEVGIFYYRYPGQPSGRISGVVRKEFLSVTGDGRSDIRTLCSKEKRFILQLPQLEKIYGEGLNEVLPAGITKELVPYGNHSRGAKFLDDSHLIDAQLSKTIDEICLKVRGFYYGRMDVRYNTWSELREGKNFSIIELNGAGSEPTHIYDPRHSIFFAWKEIIRHWVILWRISRLNHQKGISYLTAGEGLKMLRANNRFEKTMAVQNA
jgi:hypothetical protein